MFVGFRLESTLFVVGFPLIIYPVFTGIEMTLVAFKTDCNGLEKDPLLLDFPLFKLT